MKMNMEMNMENCMDLYDNEFIYYSVEYLNTISYFFYFLFISINFFIIYYLIFIVNTYQNCSLYI